MFENDLYNIDLDTDFDNEPQDDNAPAEQENPQPSQAKQNETQPRDYEPSADTKEAKHEISQEQYEYLEKARQKEELSGVVSDIQSRIPNFDFALVAKKLLSMSESDQKRYYNPQGLELLWHQFFSNNIANNARVDTARSETSLDMDDIAKKIANGDASMEEEMYFYRNLGR